MGYAATEISVLITLVYLSMVLVSAYWLRESLGNFMPSKPSLEDFKSVLLTNSKQLGEVVVLFSAPIIVDLIGGSSTQAGVIGATITISILPYYVYRSLVHVLLPEVSNQRSLGNFGDIDSRVGFFTWITVLGMFLWSLIGFFFAPSVIRLVYGPGFDITGIQGGLIFTSSGLLLLAVLFTEVLIGFERESELASAWLISLVSLAVLTTSGNPITVTATAILVYTLLSTVILTIVVVRTGVKIWKLDLSQIPWEKLH
jgi:O-antigen/teichoic acid export membrane protein